MYDHTYSKLANHPKWAISLVIAYGYLWSAPQVCGLCGYVWVNIPTQTPCGRLKWPCAITRLTAISTVKYIYAESITLLNANYQVGCQPGDCSHFYLPQGVCVDMLTHTYPHKPLGHIKWLYAITRLTAHIVWPDVWSGDLHLEVRLLVYIIQ